MTRKVLGLAISGLVAASLGAQSEQELLARHYDRVVRELRATQLVGLSKQQLAARKSLISALDEYRRRGDFGRAPLPWLQGGRLAGFVDDGGRRCAVAHLLDASGQGALTLRIAKASNAAWICELSESTELRAWLLRSGLSLREAARIQGPRRWRSTGLDFTPPDPLASVKETDLFPDAGAPSSGDSSAPSRGNTGSGTRPSPGSGRARSSGPRPRGMPLTGLEELRWSTWWTWNRDRFVVQRMRDREQKRSSDVTRARAGHAERGASIEIARQWLTSDHAALRSAARLALARLGGAAAVPDLIEGLKDRSRLNRERSVLALGRNASPRAMHALLQYIRKTKGKTPEQRQLRALALVALGVAQRHGAGMDVSKLLASLADQRKLRRSARDRDLARAVLLHQSLVDKTSLADLARKGFVDRRQRIEVREDAAAALDGSEDRESLIALSKQLTRGRNELRAAAAAALGRHGHGLALPRIRTALELERAGDPRKLLTIAVAEHGGILARDQLREQLTSSQKSHRPWAAIALGMAQRGHDDERGTRSLLRAIKSTRSVDTRAALAIALGLGAGTAGQDALAALLKDGNALLRVAAAEGLALIGSDAARDLLVKSFDKDPCPLTRARIALVLCELHEAQIAPLILKRFDAESRATRIAYLGALSHLSSGYVRDFLLRAAKDSRRSVAERANALDALSLSLAGSKRALIEVARHRDWRRLPDWVTRHLALRI